MVQIQTGSGMPASTCLRWQHTCDSPCALRSSLLRWSHTVPTWQGSPASCCLRQVLLPCLLQQQGFFHPLHAYWRLQTDPVLSSPQSRYPVDTTDRSVPYMPRSWGVLVQNWWSLSQKVLQRLLRSVRILRSYLHSPLRRLPDTPGYKPWCRAGVSYNLRWAYRNMRRLCRPKGYRRVLLLLQWTSLVLQNALPTRSLKSPVRSFQDIRPENCILPSWCPPAPVPYGSRSQRYRSGTRKHPNPDTYYVLPSSEFLVWKQTGSPGNSLCWLLPHQFLLLEYLSLFHPPIFLNTFTIIFCKKGCNFMHWNYILIVSKEMIFLDFILDWYISIFWHLPAIFPIVLARQHTILFLKCLCQGTAVRKSDLGRDLTDGLITLLHLLHGML